jgi:renalase
LRTTPEPQPTVAIVGAGIAGLAAARQLSETGIAVTVFEKSGDIGGRMATRAKGTMAFDHGAPSFDFDAPAFRDVAASWRPAVASWGPAGYVGVPDMKAPSRILAAGLTVMKNQTVMSFARQANGWTLTLSTGERTEQFSAIVLAIPSSQAAAIAASSQCSLPDLDVAVYRPCWTLMLALDGEPSGRIAAPLARVDDPVIQSIVWNSSKPGRPQVPNCVVVHATAAWSHAHLELDRTAAALQLLDAFRRVHADQSVLHAVAHRWRFAQVEKAVGRVYVWDPKQRLGACGDWCLGANVEHAVTSGSELGKRIVADMS